MMQTVRWTIGASMALAGCSLGSGVVPVGPGTYALSELRAPVRGGGAEAERVVLAEASAFCQRRGQGVVLLDARPDGNPNTLYWPTAFDATFRCGPGPASDTPSPIVPRR